MFRFRVKRQEGQWNVWLEGPLDRWLCKKEHVNVYNCGNQWLGQVEAPNLKMALVRLQHLIPELQE